MSFTTPNPGEEVVAAHVSQITNSASGAANGGQIWSLIQLSDASNPALTLRNVSNASGAAGLRVYKTVTGVDTDLLKVTNSDSMVTVKNLTVTGTYTQAAGSASDLTAAIMARGTINAKDWGVLADGSDATAAINTIFATYRAIPPSAPGTGLDLYFPPGRYSIGKINATGINNVTIRGVHNGTAFYADQQTSAGAVWDFTGSSDLKVEDIYTFGYQYGNTLTPTHVPTVWYLISSSSAGAGADSNANEFRNLGGQGHASVACIYLNDTVDTTFIWSHPFIADNNLPNLRISSNNGGSVASAFLTPNASGGNMTNVTFVNWGGSALQVDDNVGNINFFGGNFDATTAGYCVKLAGSIFKLGFYNTQFTKNGGSAAGLVSAGSGTYHNLAFENCWFFNSLGASTSLINKTSASALFKNLRITGLTPGEASGFNIMDGTTAASGATVVIDGGYIDCGDGNLAPGGTIQGVTINNVGTYTRMGGGLADEVNCLFIDPGSYPTGGSGIVLQNDALRVGSGGAGSPTIGFTSDTSFDTGIYRAAENSMGFTAAGAAVATVSSSGLIMQNSQPIQLASSGAASTGALRLAKNTGMYARNNGGSADITLIATNTSDEILIGGSANNAAITLDAATLIRLRHAGTDMIQINGTGIGFNNATPIARPDYTITNPSTDRALNVSGDTTAQVAAVLGTLLQDLIDYGLLQ